MFATRAFLIVLLTTAAAPAAELRTLKGEVHTGKVVSVTSKEIVIDTGEKKITTPIDQVLHLNLKGAGKPPEGQKYALVELTDSTRLRCAKVMLKGKDATLVLLTGQEVKLPIARLSYVLNEAHLEFNRKQWKEKVLSKKRSRDVIAVKSEGVVNAIEGTLGDADAEGKTIAFTLPGDEARQIPIGRPMGLYFTRGPDPTLKPAVCKVSDAGQNYIYASTVSKGDDGFTIVTSSGATIKYTADQLTRLDYSQGKLTYLADVNPITVDEQPVLDYVQHYRRNENLDGGIIHIAGVEYKSGLSIHATTELVYDIGGEYREFKAVAGIDDDVGGDDGPVVLKIYGDGNELLNMTFSRKDKEQAQAIALNVKDVQKLKIVVTTTDLLALGKHLTLADARVSK